MAVEHQAAILTGDGDFSDMVAIRRLSAPYVIYVRTQERNPSGPGELVVAAWNKLVADASTGYIVTIDERGSRMRKLPIQPKT